MLPLQKRPIARFRDLLTPFSKLRFGLWWITGGRSTITIQLKTGLRIAVRPLSTTDYGVAVDVFLRRCYDDPQGLPGRVHQIVDLGSNVGYSVLHWLTVVPNARVVAFEPHPAHVAALNANLVLNGLGHRVETHQAAVGVTEADAYLADCGSSSSLGNHCIGFKVRVVDFYTAITGPIDILKVDIEGMEYELLGDPRLSVLRPRIIVAEWHGVGGFARLNEILRTAGYTVVKAGEGPHDTGLLWAYLR